ncbi:hypothetical protein EPUS_02904 [Endocarpon pusillum Z07020]|uniref:Sacsin/Nov domain-containing protein n=1 Tax=Endocarpon pusillum (strain Z07020 / HMAS-L-300199) TaxID=1263415 RepID=U1GIZ8_ENDPU|nr:uncharacterized protein EPUS_02904 [Endocarpon pusillum Z07020]ERF72113.1 hypothetical protein EPUS_02904 [Endocarpon pusillum Z07020]
MVPQPKKQAPQRQPLTVALRKICRDYPAGAGILKELLQNADDAGASTVKFTLDTHFHDTSPLLHEGLAEYQGPALLAFNNALFTEEDFQSLTSLGDSKKLQDKVATGKFGLGFSSVFNWTDCPSILSGSDLLFFDPHQSWSRSFEPPGGPFYDISASTEDESMITQLDGFSLVNTEWDRPFMGTIIRIPLRTASQAAVSEISNKETTTDDVRDALDSFADDMGSNGLLFLKSVRRIVLSINDQLMTEVKITSKDSLAEPEGRLRTILRSIINDEDKAGGEIYHEVDLSHEVAGGKIEKKFGVLNLVTRSSNVPSLDSWAASEKLFPWVAVAAPLRDCSSTSNSKDGRLFSTLPLPCLTGMPIQIHGLFSISADRSRLHGLDDGGVQDHRPKEWNKFLFDQLIPMAWAKLLQNICQNTPRQDHSHLWPSSRSDAQQLWDGMCPAVVNQVFENQFRVWYTSAGHVALEDGLLALNSTHLKERTAFREADLPIIFAELHVFEEARCLPGSRTLCPRTLYQLLQQTKKVDRLSRPSRLVLLEYLVCDIPITELGTLEIFPFEDGRFRSLNQSTVFLHKNNLEKTLFTQQTGATIDTDQLSATASEIMHDQVRKDDRMVRYRKPEDLRDYYLKHIANGSGDSVVLDENGRSKLNLVWRWMLQYHLNELPLAALGSLCFVTWFRPGEVNNISVKIFASNPKNAPNILADDFLDVDIQQRLLGYAEKEQSLGIKDGNKFGNFLQFLAQRGTLLRNEAEEIKYAVLRLLKQLYWSPGYTSTEQDRKVLKSLWIFQAVEWPADGADTSLMRWWTNMNINNVTFIGLKTLVPIPSSPNDVFIDMTKEVFSTLFEGLGLLKCLNDGQILEEVVIPALHSGSYDCLSSALRLEAVNRLFQNYYHISAHARNCLSKLEVVPLTPRSNDGNLNFGRPTDVLDPQQPALRSLYFEDEICLPEKQFYTRFGPVLAQCGIMRSLDQRVITDRISCFGRTGQEFAAVASRAKSLLTMPLLNTGEALDLANVARSTKWLPAQSPAKSNSFTTPSECRDIDEKLIVGHVWHVLPFQIHESWRPILGWQCEIDVDVLMRQLVASIAAFDLESLEQTLCYIRQHHLLERCAERLLKLSFIRSSTGELVRADRACRRGGEKLRPYLYTVEPRFWDVHTDIMKMMNIYKYPSVEQLMSVLNALGSEKALNEGELDVAVEVTRIWSLLYCSRLEGLKMPDTHGMLRDTSDLVFNDTPWLSAGERAIVHPKVSRSVADRLMVEPLSVLLMNGVLGITDLDDDEFCQREEVADGIRDTLERYTRESTFHEYLANADDCGTASETNFLIDPNTYDTKYLLTKELGDLQGPSLLIHNNGVFTEENFEGLKRVGRGSKRDDPNSIGKFGRGSQTMYHWTDVPMILSGRFLLILDPLQTRLPFNYLTKQKKPGILLEYAKIKSACYDQLAPFEGLWGFNSDQDSYNGTIFRFPLRKEGQGSELLESRRPPDVSTTIGIFHKCFDEARLALLFLRNLETIDFSIKGGADFEWRVGRQTWPQSGAFSDWAHVLVEQHSPHGKLISTTEQWWRVIVDVLDPQEDLQDRHKRRMKYVECGIAELVPSADKAISPLQPLASRFFNCLPLKFESNLPVHIHATFLLSGDRQNITIEESSQDSGSKWNKWLLEKRLPRVYLQFLEDIGRKIGHDVYNYFPTGTSGREQLSDLIRVSFWKEIRSSSYRLFPVVNAAEEVTKLRSRGRSNRIPPNLVTFEAALFDTLDTQKSNALRPILSNCLNNLVCPPWRLRGHFKTTPEGPQIKVLTPAIVRGVLRSTRARELVEKTKQMDKDFLDVLLSYIVPTTTDEVVELDGCPILPLADGGLGTLSLRSRMSSDKVYFVADAECQRLFSFAASLFCGNETRYASFVGKILDSGLLNLKTLAEGDVSTVLGLKGSWAPGPASEKWLVYFWDYINSITVSMEAAIEPKEAYLNSLQQFPLLLVRTHGGKAAINSLHYFWNNACVVQSAIREQVNLLADFKGLGIVDSRTLPASTRRAEKSLLDLASINRLIRSLKLLAGKEGKTLKEFVRATVKEENIKTFRNIIASHPQLLDESARDLPVWPRISSKSGYLTAREAFLAQNSAFVVPWIKEYHQFTMFNRYHQHASIDDVGMLERFVLLNLPDSIGGKNKEPYTRLVDAIMNSTSLKGKTGNRNKKGSLLVPLAAYRLAARRDGRLCLASELFDHTDPVFSAAFGAEATDKFLMTGVEHHLSPWKELGIRCREQGRFKGRDYLACLLLYRAG